MQHGDEKLLRFHFDRWRLTADGEAFHTRSAVLQPVSYRGVPAMLKIVREEEERQGIALLKRWNGNGAVRVLELDGDGVLMERACGSGSLAEMARRGQDDEASMIICSVVAMLHSLPKTAMSELIALPNRFESLRRNAATYGGVIETAASVADGLLAAPEDTVVLHGDIHHGNILDAGPRGWLAIDPKGLVGERGFDFANIFCNPDSFVACSPDRLARQATVVAKAAALDRDRLLRWIAAWSALSAVWHIEDGSNAKTAITVAKNAVSMLGRNL